MKIKCYSFENLAPSDQICSSDVSITGCAVDERGRASIQFSNDNSRASHELTIDSNKLTYNLLNNTYAIDDIEPLISIFTGNSILIDATTMGFLELFLCLLALQECKAKSFKILYVEPETYSLDNNYNNSSSRMFDLSKITRDYYGVPSRVIRISQNKKVKFLISTGYEGGRLQKLFNQFEGQDTEYNLILGVPPFQAGWDMNSYANIVQELDSRSVKSIMYAGASNPITIYNQISKFYNSKSSNENLILAPIGTKPHALGMALFALNHDDVGLIYDSPDKRPGRSNGVGLYHAYHCIILNHD